MNVLKSRVIDTLPNETYLAEELADTLNELIDKYENEYQDISIQFSELWNGYYILGVPR